MPRPLGFPRACLRLRLQSTLLLLLLPCCLASDATGSGADQQQQRLLLQLVPHCGRRLQLQLAR
jgi:hypothetical protein